MARPSPPTGPGTRNPTTPRGSRFDLYRTSTWTEVGTAPLPYPAGNDDYADGRFFFSADGTKILSTLTAVPYPYGYNRPVSQIVSVPDLVQQAAIAEPEVLGAPTFAPDGSLFALALANGTTGVWRTSDLSLLSLTYPGEGSVYALPWQWGVRAPLVQKIYNPLTGAALGPGLAHAISPDGRLGMYQFTPNSWVFRLSDLGIPAQPCRRRGTR